MQYAYANKDQMMIFKSAAKPVNDGYPESPLTKVVLWVRYNQGFVATLFATNSSQAMQRNVCITDEFASNGSKKTEVKVAVPMDAIKLAYGAMVRGDRAYFEDNKIVVKAVEEDPETQEDTERVKASIPFLVQAELFDRIDDILHTGLFDATAPKLLTIDAKVLMRITEQLKSGDAHVYVNLYIPDDKSKVILTAFEEVEDEELRAIVMPIAI